MIVCARACVCVLFAKVERYVPMDAMCSLSRYCVNKQQLLKIEFHIFRLNFEVDVVVVVGVVVATTATAPAVVVVVVNNQYLK